MTSAAVALRPSQHWNYNNHNKEQQCIKFERLIFDLQRGLRNNMEYSSKENDSSAFDRISTEATDGNTADGIENAWRDLVTVAAINRRDAILRERIGRARARSAAEESNNAFTFSPTKMINRSNPLTPPAMNKSDNSCSSSQNVKAVNSNKISPPTTNVSNINQISSSAALGLQVAMEHAVRRGRIRVVRKLFVQAEYYRRTPLNEGACLSQLMGEAVADGHVDIVKELIKHGADPNYIHRERSHLSRAVASGVCPMIVALIQHGADPKHTTPTGKTILHEAVASSSYDVINCLLDNGACSDVRDKIQGNTPLHTACSYSNRGAIFAIYEKGVEFNAINHFGDTPLAKLLRPLSKADNFHNKTRAELAKDIIRVGFALEQRKRRIEPRCESAMQQHSEISFTPQNLSSSALMTSTSHSLQCQLSSTSSASKIKTVCTDSGETTRRSSSSTSELAFERQTNKSERSLRLVTRQNKHTDSSRSYKQHRSTNNDNIGNSSINIQRTSVLQLESSSISAPSSKSNNSLPTSSNAPSQSDPPSSSKDISSPCTSPKYNHQNPRHRPHHHHHHRHHHNQHPPQVERTQKVASLASPSSPQHSSTLSMSREKLRIPSSAHNYNTVTTTTTTTTNNNIHQNHHLNLQSTTPSSAHNYNTVLTTTTTNNNNNNNNNNNVHQSLHHNLPSTIPVQASPARPTKEDRLYNIYHHLLSTATTTLSLQGRCRLTILHSIGTRSLSSSVENLGLPNLVQRYLRQGGL